MSIPSILIIGIFLMSEALLLGINLKWRKTVQTQIRINDCVATHAHALKDSLETIEAHNRRINVLRKLAIATTLNPAALKSIKIWLNIESQMQNLQLLKWKWTQARWLIKRGCDSKDDIPNPLPSQPWRAQPRDLIGPKPLLWTATGLKEFYILLRSDKRKSGALINQSKQKWELKWTIKEHFLLKVVYGS